MFASLHERLLLRPIPCPEIVLTNFWDSPLEYQLGPHDGNTYASTQAFLYTRNVRVSWNRRWSNVTLFSCVAFLVFLKKRDTEPFDTSVGGRKWYRFEQRISVYLGNIPILILNSPRF